MVSRRRVLRVAYDQAHDPQSSGYAGANDTIVAFETPDPWDRGLSNRCRRRGAQRPAREPVGQRALAKGKLLLKTGAVFVAFPPSGLAPFQTLRSTAVSVATAA